MSKFTGPKAKRCRRQGINLYGSDKYDKILQRKPTAPGKNPRARGSRKSEYANQLQEKQRARDTYGLSERQFVRLYKESAHSKLDTGDVLKVLLEQRLDNLIYRAGLAMTRLQARQFVGHGHFLVDGIRVTTPSFRIQPGQKITARARSKSSPVFSTIRSENEKYLAPSWMKVDSANLTIEIISLPTAEDAEQSANMRQVVEFYSR